MRIIQLHMKTRQFLILLFCMIAMGDLPGQTVDDFISVEPQMQDGGFDLPATHTWQYLIQRADTLPSGDTLPPNSDFTGFVPINGSSERGYLAINSEWVPGGVTVLDLHVDSLSRFWKVTAGELVDFSPLGGIISPATRRNCSGTVTPWQSVITCEEETLGGDANQDGYIDAGWNTEIDPVTRQIKDYDGDGTPDKLWAMGRMRHENIVVTSDSLIAYQGEDAFGRGFLFKYTLDQPGDLSEGTLWALKMTSDSAGKWIHIPNSTQTERNHTSDISLDSGATAFLRVEDVEIGPDGRIYFASTTQGKVFRFLDEGTVVSRFETFINNQNFPITHAGGVKNTFFNAPDNLVFDGEGNLWVTQDNSLGHIWVFGPSHTSTAPDARIFANSPAGSEPTGITFSPDYRYLFCSFQHPFPANTQAELDVTGRSVVLNRDLTLVIARNEVFMQLNGIREEKDAATANWSIGAVYPNPLIQPASKSVIHLELTTQIAGRFSGELRNVQGKLVREFEAQLTPGEQVITFPIGKLAPSAYQLRMELHGKPLTRTIVIH